MVIIALGITTISACGGGGSSPSTEIAPVSNSSFVVTDNNRVLVSEQDPAKSLTVVVNAPVETSGLSAPLSVSEATSISDASTATYLAGNSTEDGIVLSLTLGEEISFSTSDGDIITKEEISFGDRFSLTDSADDDLETKDATVLATDHHYFGVWGKDYDKDIKTGGVFSAGPRTIASAMPTGTATYEGVTLGYFVRVGDPQVYKTSGQMTANADFSNGEITMSTSKVHVRVSIPGTASNSVWFPGLTAGGTLAIDGNSISGTLTDAGGRKGTANGNFYGPNASDVGGVASMTGNGTHVFSFGAKRQ